MPGSLDRAHARPLRSRREGGTLDMRDAMRRAPGLLAVPVLVAMLAGCGGDDSKSKAPAAAAPAAPPAPSSAPRSAAPPEQRTQPDPAALGVEGTLPADVPVPKGAKALHPPMVASGTTRASFEVGDPLASVQAFYKAQLAQDGWSIDAEKDLEAQSLISAKKGERELSVAMSETSGHTQLVLLLIGG
jgi:hypothetical protein